MLNTSFWEKASGNFPGKFFQSVIFLLTKDNYPTSVLWYLYLYLCPWSFHEIKSTCDLIPGEFFSLHRLPFIYLNITIFDLCVVVLLKLSVNLITGGKSPVKVLNLNFKYTDNIIIVSFKLFSSSVLNSHID